MIEPGLVDRLEAQVSGIGSRVYPGKLPQNPTYPAIAYAQISNPRQHTHDGPDGCVEARYQITAFSDSYAEAKGVAEDIREALDGFTGTMNDVEVAFTRHDGGRDVFDDQAEVNRGVWMIQTDYMIQYTEA